MEQETANNAIKLWEGVATKVATPLFLKNEAIKTKHGGRMNRYSRILVVLLSALLLISFFTPIWSIQLEAPQYPEGLGMFIHINGMSGDLNIINQLNHYIGMKHIDPASFKELVYMPYIIGSLMVIGIFSGIVGKRWLLYTFTILFIIIGIVGIVDFYLWEYDYGHNLIPGAAIKIPGMTYQPPLIGSKQLLNFNAISLPATGGIAIFITGAGIVMLSIYELINKKKQKI